jgi:outer membrane protein assembly factor BamD (BamD/ComL family)
VALEVAPAPDELPQAESPSAPAARADRAASQSALAAELAALDQARARLDSGDASGALSLLDDYSRTYPRGRLALEAEVLRIDALAKKGQAASAAKRAEAFLRRHPNSVLASRVRGYLQE